MNAAGAVGLILARIRAALVQSNRNAVTVREENSTAANDLSLHDSGAGFVYGVTDTDVKSSLFVLDSTRLRTSLVSDEIDEDDAGPFAFALPCTLRYMFNQRMLTWNVNAAVAAAPANATMQNTFWGTSNLGLGPDEEKENGNRLQQETAPFVTFCQPDRYESLAGGGINLPTGRIHFDVECEPLFEIKSIFQDFVENDVAAQWRNDNDDGDLPQTATNRRDNDDGRKITVMSVGLMDDLQRVSEMGQHARSARTKFDVLTLNAGHGSTCICRVAHTHAPQRLVAHAIRPLMQALGNQSDNQPLNRDNLSVMVSRLSGSQPVILTPHYVAQHNALLALGANQLEHAEDIIYIGNANFSFDKNRHVFLIMNDRGNPVNGAIDTAVPVHPSVLFFETKDCEPVLHFDEFYNFANVMTRVRNVREVIGGPAIHAMTQPLWTVIMSATSMGAGNTPIQRENNRSFCTMHFPSFEFQDTYWNAAPFETLASDSLQTGVVHRSQLRVSQHLCAPLINPNRRIGCSAPLNYDSVHLPPELRDFRIELRDVDFSFLPGVSTATLESLTMYEFNGGNQLAGTQPSLLYMPHFREFSTSTIGQSFEMQIFSPYGNPSYIAIYARSKTRPNEYIKQPLVKTLTISSGTTMKKSNTILEAREHELFHLTQRNVHPRAEYTRSVNQKRQVILLCAEDIGDMGVAAYQKEKRANFTLSGSLDLPATVTALFIYNNRGLSVQNLEIGVVRV